MKKNRLLIFECCYPANKAEIDRVYLHKGRDDIYVVVYRISGLETIESRIPLPPKLIKNGKVHVIKLLNYIKEQSLPIHNFSILDIPENSYIDIKKFTLFTLQDDINKVAVYRVIPSADDGYSISAEIDGKVEITQYDNNGNPTMRTYGNIGKRKYKRFKIQICSVKEMYLISKYIKLDNAAVIMCSSYPIDTEKCKKIKNRLILQFDDITNQTALTSFNADKAETIKNFIDSLGPEVKALYVCCDSGESRSTALSAAIMRYFKTSDKDIWTNPYYHPNPLVYKIQCKAFGIFVTNIGIRMKVQKNKDLFRMLIQNK